MDRKKDYLSRYYPESRFGGFTDIDGTIAFYIRVQALLEPSSIVLDVGCGRGAYAEHPIRIKRELRTLKGKCRRAIGIDVDRQAVGNPLVDEVRLIEGARWPVEDASIDVCVCDSVLEHVQDPAAFFAECRRTLKPGGYLCLRTSNRLNYLSLLARLIPNRLHARVLDRVLPPWKNQEDVFPTVYRCNTRGRLRRMLDRHGLDHCVYGYEAEPYHLGFSRLAYFCGVLHQRLAPNLCKTTLFAFARKA